jgi:hypothetical protein
MSKPVSTLSDLLGGLSTEAAQQVQSALTRAIAAGASIASIAKQVMSALNTSLFRALTVARNVLVQGFRDSSMDTAQTIGTPIGWYWITDLAGKPCIACILMHGTKHTMEEDMISHTNCACIQQFFTAQEAQDSSDMQSGEDWFNEQSDETQEDILGPTKYDAVEDGTITIQDILGTDSAGRIYVKTLKELGISA